MASLKELREARGLSQGQLAELAGTSQPQIARLESGDRPMKVDWAVRLAPLLGVEPADLLPGLLANSAPTGMKTVRPRSGAETKSGAARVCVPPPRVYTSHYGMMPVRSAARGGADQEMFLEDGPVDWIEVPEYLKNAKDPYAMFVVGESMMPRYRPAQVLHVNPHRPPAPGNGVIIVKNNNAVLVKEFVGRSLMEVCLREYGPNPREFTVPLAEIQAIHTVAGLQEA